MNVTFLVKRTMESLFIKTILPNLSQLRRNDKIYFTKNQQHIIIPKRVVTKNVTVVTKNITLKVRYITKNVIVITKFVTIITKFVTIGKFFSLVKY